MEEWLMTISYSKLEKMHSQQLYLTFFSVGVKTVLFRCIQRGSDKSAMA